MITRLERREYLCTIEPFVEQAFYEFADYPGEMVVESLCFEPRLHLEFYTLDGEACVRVVRCLDILTQEWETIVDDRVMEEPNLEFRLGNVVYLIILE